MTDVAWVEITASQAEPEMQALVVEACAAASSSSAHCVLAPAPTNTPGFHIQVIVRFDDAGLGATIELSPAGARQNVATRELHFKPDDDPHERWKTVGFVIGSVAEGMRPREVPPPVEKPPKPSPRPPPAVWIDAVGLVGSALDDGSVRAGASIRAAWAVPKLPLLVTGAFRYGVRPGDEEGLSIHWIGGSVGLGLHTDLGTEQLELAARLELVAELMLATVTLPFTEQSDSSSRWVGGGRLSGELGYSPWRSFGFVAGIDATLVQSGTVVKVDATTSGRAPPYQIAGFAGLRGRFP